MDKSITKSKPGDEIVEGLEGGVPESKIVCASTSKEANTNNPTGAEAELRKWFIDKDTCTDRGIKLEGTMERLWEKRIMESGDKEDAKKWARDGKVVMWCVVGLHKRVGFMFRVNKWKLMFMKSNMTRNVN